MSNSRPQSQPPLIDHLPEELLLTIFELLDSSPPSIIKSRQEPSLEITSSSTSSSSGKHIYKDLSSVSRRWRRIMLPLLYRFSRVHLSINNNEVEDLDAFLQFIRKNKLRAQSVVLTISKEPSERDRPSSSSALQNHQPNSTTTTFWKNLLETTKSSRIVIVASPADLARLTQCTIDLSTEWAFEDMDYHLLELRYDAPLPTTSTSSSSSVSQQQTMLFDPHPETIAAESILMMKPWSHLGLNEGSFLKAYSTYEYFERGPPSIVYSIMNCFSSKQMRSTMTRSSLRSFSYTAILPFADHLYFEALIPHLEELDVQLAPDPSSNILNEKSRIGRAQMDDCWQELRAAYRLLTRSFRTFAISADGSPKLKRFICRDFQILALAEDLDDEFVPLCMPCWCEDPRGVFSRLADAPHIYDQL